jgi:hypothetical protein
MRKVALVVWCLAVSAGILLGDEWTKRTEITFNEPVIVAGYPVVTLEPGTYVIRLMNHDHNRNIVQIFNDREDKLYTTVLAINNYRLNPTDKTTMTFYETPAGNPIALRSWFFPWDNWGQEFVYPKGLAAKIAKETGAPVLTTPAESPAELKEAPVAAVTKEGIEQPLPEAYREPEPPLVASLEPVAPEAVAAPEPEPEPQPEPAPAPEPVPTATPFFTLALGGLFAAASGIGLRKLVRS